MLLNSLLIVIKRNTVDIPLIKNYIESGIRKVDAFDKYNKTVKRYSGGRLPLLKKEFDEVWDYLK